MNGDYEVMNICFWRTLCSAYRWKTYIEKENCLPIYMPFDDILKWHYSKFSMHKLAFNCHIFQKIAIYNDEWQIKWRNYLLKSKNKNCQNIKKKIKSSTLFIFWMSNATLYFFLFIFLYYNFVETIFNIDLCTQSTKYTVT